MRESELVLLIFDESAGVLEAALTNSISSVIVWGLDCLFRPFHVKFVFLVDVLFTAVSSKAMPNVFFFFCSEKF
jgi:hypothetical protein